MMQTRKAEFSLHLLRETSHSLRTTWPHYTPARLHHADDQNHLATIVTLAQRADLRDTVADLHEHIYRAQHAWSPVGEITDQFRMSVFLDPDELVPDAQFIAILEEQPVGIASLRVPFSMSCPEMGWIGVLDSVPDPTGDHIHRQLFDACLSYARQIQGDIRFEVDDADHQTLQRCRSLDVDWEESLLHFVKRVEQDTMVT